MLSKALFTVYETFHIDVHQVAMLGFFKTSGQVLRFVAFRCAESCSYFVHILSFFCVHISSKLRSYFVHIIHASIFWPLDVYDV